MNLCSISYAIIAYALGNMILIPMNAALMEHLDPPQVLLASVIAAVSFAGLHKLVEMINEFQLTPDPL